MKKRLRPTSFSVTQLIHLFNKYRIDPNLRILLQRIATNTSCELTHVLQDHPLFPLKDYENLHRSQSKIGWQNFLKGYPSYQWITHQSRYIKEMYLPVKTSDTVWLQRIYIQVLYIQYQRWTHRNNILHSHNRDHERDMLLNRIQGLYSLRDSMHRQDHHCFKISIQEWKTKPIPEMKKWLHLHTEHIRHCMRQEKSRLRQNIQDIRSWLKATPKDAKQLKSQPMLTNAPRKPKLQKPLHRFFSNSSKSTDIKSNVTKKTRETTVMSRLRTSVHNAYIQTTLRIKHKRSHQVPPKEHQELNLVEKMPCTKETNVIQTPESHHSVKRNTTGSDIARSIKKFTRWRWPSASNKNKTKQVTGELTMGRGIGK